MADQKWAVGTAAVVDTTGNFDVVALYTLILDRVRQQQDTAVHDVKQGGAKAEHVATTMLERIHIMRVFDLEGVSEAIAEIRLHLEAKRREEHTRPSTPTRPTPEPLTPDVPQQRTVVADSDDEEEEMLFDTADAAVESQPACKPPSPAPAVSLQEKAENTGTLRFILIDNLAQVVSPLLKKDYIQANHLSSTFLQALGCLTRTHSLYTVLSNPTTVPRSASPTRHPQGPRLLAPDKTDPQPPPPPPLASIFASNAVVPSLINVLASHVDVSLLVSRLPKRKGDAKACYRAGHAPGTSKVPGVEYVTVVEVMADRWEGRVGSWVTL
ncbi:hypothetical protein ACEQ8H_005685 [Pleosporales sp. CAS-2024a]